MGSEGLGAGCDGVGLPGILQLRCADQSPHPERDFACFFFFSDVSKTFFIV